MKWFVKIFFIVTGTLSLMLGVLGIFIPGLPVTPFVLVAAWLYCNSSQKLYNKLVQNKLVGKYIARYRKNKGMTLKQKIHSISLMWIMIAVSVWLFINPMYVKFIVIGVGIVGTIVMGFVIKTVNPQKTDD